VLNPDTLPVAGSNKWHRFDDVVAVVSDLKGSTRLGTGTHAKPTAKIYDAAVSQLSRIYKHFGSDFQDIQGDGGFALFSGDFAYERALCAGITVKTFSERHLIPALTEHWDDEAVAQTGYKVGIAASPLLAAKVGVRYDTSRQEPVWAGKAVNYAAKAAQVTERHSLLVSASVWAAIDDNQYLTYTCDCSGGPSNNLWKEQIIGKLPDDDDERDGMLLETSWCVTCGDAFCAAIITGEKVRPSVQRALREKNLKVVREGKRTRHRNRLFGLRH
jgi:class 3 adenylate cyclase